MVTLESIHPTEIKPKPLQPVDWQARAIGAIAYQIGSQPDTKRTETPYTPETEVAPSTIPAETASIYPQVERFHRYELPDERAFATRARDRLFGSAEAIGRLLRRADRQPKISFQYDPDQIPMPGYDVDTDCIPQSSLNKRRHAGWASAAMLVAGIIGIIGPRVTSDDQEATLPQVTSTQEGRSSGSFNLEVELSSSVPYTLTSEGAEDLITSITTPVDVSFSSSSPWVYLAGKGVPASQIMQTIEDVVEYADGDLLLVDQDSNNGNDRDVVVETREGRQDIAAAEWIRLYEESTS